MCIKNAYIHIPFCRGKCFYCSFVSYNKLELIDDYLNALNIQIESEYSNEKLRTLYLGGGTPSILTIEQIKSVLSKFDFETDAEITIEVNPNDVNFEYLNQLKVAGINRLSIGAQTFDDKILKSIGRRHNSSDVFSAVSNALNAGFENISVDFIYGLPNQTIEGFANDLRVALDLNVQHISLYGLKIDKDCYFSTHKPENLPDIDTQADMYLKAVEILTNNEFEHYEVSNFAKKTFESKHNLNYWENNSYYGLGCAASGYDGKIRYTNQSDLDDYINNPLKKAVKSELSEEERLEEAIFLGFRKISGINISQIDAEFAIDFEAKYIKILQKYKEYFIKTQNGYALTLQGTLISNSILSEFIGY